MSNRKHDWPAIDTRLRAVPVPAPPGRLAALAAELAIPPITLAKRRQQLRHVTGRVRYRTWTPDREARLHAGLAALAAELGCSLGAVIERARLLGPEWAAEEGGPP